MIVYEFLSATFSLFESMLGLVPESLGTLDLPSAIVLVAPIPILTAGQVAQIDTWFTATIAVAGTLAIGSLLQWIYRNIPGKFT